MQQQFGFASPQPQAPSVTSTPRVASSSVNSTSHNFYSGIRQPAVAPTNYFAQQIAQSQITGAHSAHRSSSQPPPAQHAQVPFFQHGAGTNPNNYDGIRNASALPVAPSSSFSRSLHNLVDRIATNSLNAQMTAGASGSSYFNDGANSYSMNRTGAAGGIHSNSASSARSGFVDTMMNSANIMMLNHGSHAVPSQPFIQPAFGSHHPPAAGVAATDILAPPDVLEDSLQLSLVTFSCSNCGSRRQRGSHCSRCDHALPVTRRCPTCKAHARGRFCSSCGSQCPDPAEGTADSHDINNSNNNENALGESHEDDHEQMAMQHHRSGQSSRSHSHLQQQQQQQPLAHGAMLEHGFGAPKNESWREVERAWRTRAGDAY